MGNRKRIIAGIILAAVYAFFFASTNLFYHSHIISDVKIVHSHPLSGAAHSHNADQVSLIEVLDSAVYQETGALFISAPVPEMMFIAEAADIVTAPCGPAILSFSLRAPPAHC